MRLNILYRGPLSSCNYQCYYCPFAKQTDSPEELQYDRDCLERFVSWAERTTDRELGIFFTPWGEALTRRWYWHAFQRLTACRHIAKVAIQTNLSAGLDWIADCDTSKIGIWATYHPSQSTIDKFLQQVRRLFDYRVSFSVGMVGIREDFPKIEEMRSKLPSSVYLWINAYKSQQGYYSEEDVAYLTAIDRHFPTNNTYHPSLGSECSTGENAISVDGEGTIRRCHFVKSPIGNLYENSLDEVLKPRLCPNQNCGCHIGYVHMPELKLHTLYENGLLERAPRYAGAMPSLSLPERGVHDEPQQ